MPSTRIITAVCLLAIFIPALFLAPAQLWAFGMLLVALLAFDEWNELLGWRGKKAFLLAFLATVAGLCTIYTMETRGFHWFFFQSIPVFFITSLFWLLMAPVCLANRYLPQNRPLMSLLGFVLIGALWLAIVCAQSADPWLLLALLGTVWIADTCAYVAGKNFGQHKLAPAISPGKTWEGVAGALVGVTVFAIILKHAFAVDSWLLFPALWLLTAISVVGDLFESLLKRRADVKDSSNLLPGHGGVLDRLDALIPAIPFALTLIYIYNLLQVN